MDLTLGCGGDSYVANMGVDLLALGTIGLLLARKRRASRWLSAALSVWYLSWVLPQLVPRASLTLDQLATLPSSVRFVIGCAVLALVLPFLPSPPADWRTMRLRSRRRSPRVYSTHARGLLIFITTSD